jgi:hypothetical protein
MEARDLGAKFGCCLPMIRKRFLARVRTVLGEDLNIVGAVNNGREACTAAIPPNLS